MATSSRRRWWWLGTVGAVILVFLAGWFAAVQFRSPAQREAEALPPTAGPIYNPVTRGDLSDQVSGSGNVNYASVSSVMPVNLPANAVVTRRPIAAGQPLTSGAVISEIDGAPVFLLPGAFDFYRDLGPGLSGPDVRQLQDGLRAAGLSVDSGEDASYGPSTRAAVATLQRRAGYPATGTLELSELAVVASMPAVAVTVPSVGVHPSSAAPLATVGRGAVVVSISLDGAAAVRTAVGMTAEISLSGTSQTVPGRVSAIATGSGQSQQSSVTLVTTTPLPASDVRRPAVGIITVKLLAAQAMLVPQRAVVTGRDGSDRLMVKRGDGPAAPVTVTVLGSLAGVCAVQARPSDSLRPGDLVQVG